MLYKHERHGWKEAVGAEIADIEAAGWVKSSYDEFSEFVAAKRGKQAQNAVTIVPEVTQQEAVKGKPGRKPKSLASLGGNYGNSSAGNQS